MGVEKLKNVAVLKFGGTSVGSSERISAVAQNVLRHVKRTGEKVVVVVSAMSGETDRLISIGRNVSGGSLEMGREYHQLVTAGEHASIALVSMALKQAGQKSISLLAHQIPIRTKTVFGQNLIDSIETDYLTSLLEDGYVPVIAGFQGIGDSGEFTTLGRGGSDTSAVAIAAALGSVRCYISRQLLMGFTLLYHRSVKKLKN